MIIVNSFLEAFKCCTIAIYFGFGQLIYWVISFRINVTPFLSLVIWVWYISSFYFVLEYCFGFVPYEKK